MSTDFANVHASGVTQEGVYAPDKLYDRDTQQKKITLISGAGSLIRGTVLGKITDGAHTAVAANGAPAPAGATMSAVVATTASVAGVHRFVCATAGATGKWNHFNPLGEFVAQATTGTEYVGGGLTLTITDTATDPAVGEVFLVTVSAAAGSGKYLKSLAAATDGSEEPDVILLEPVDATSADKEALVATRGRFNSGALTYGTGHSLATVEATLRGKGITFDTVIG